jgi:CDGSH-type Zn-finger protein
MPTKIIVKTNGSIQVEGDFELVDVNGNKFDLKGRTAVSFCRCGQSKDKPFCDGTHKKVEFHSEIIAHTLPPLATKS